MTSEEREAKIKVIHRLGIELDEPLLKGLYLLPGGQKVQISYSKGHKLEDSLGIIDKLGEKRRYLFALFPYPKDNIPHAVFICGTHEYSVILHQQVIADLIRGKQDTSPNYWKINVYASPHFFDLEIHFNSSPVMMDTYESLCRFDLLTGEKYWLIPNRGGSTSSFCFFCGQRLPKDKIPYLIMRVNPFAGSDLNLLLNPAERYDIWGECCYYCAWLRPEKREATLYKRVRDMEDHIKILKEFLM